MNRCRSAHACAWMRMHAGWSSSSLPWARGELEERAALSHHGPAHHGNRRAAVGEEFLVEVVPPCMRVVPRCRWRARQPVAAQLPDHQLAEGVFQVLRIVGATRRLLAGIACILVGALTE